MSQTANQELREPGAGAPGSEPRDPEAGLREQVDRLRRENRDLRAENARLRSDNAGLRAALDAHVQRNRSTALYGPLEMTAGTSVGPRRRRGG